MKIPILSLENAKISEKELPEQFNEFVSESLIKRAALVIQNNARQPYGADPEAGKRASAKLSRRRRNYKGSYGKGISRVPRKTMVRRGAQFIWVGAFAPGTVGGRRAHPPKADKILEEKINKKENRKAIRSAIAATIMSNYVSKYHKTPKTYPFAAEKKVEDIAKTKDVLAALKKWGLKEELDRASSAKVRAGKGKTRGRKYQVKTGPAIIVSKDCALEKAARNIKGISIIKVDSLNALELSNGTKPGRLTIFTESALERMQKDKLFMK